MSKTVKRVLIVSASFIIAGMGFFTLGKCMGGETGFAINRTGLHTNRELKEASAKQLAVLEKTELEGFRNMNIRVDSNDIEIVPSDDGRFYLEYRLYTYGSDPKYRVDQGTLDFECILEPLGQMNVGFLVWDTGSSYENEIGTLKVYVPKDRQLDNVKLQNSDGDIRYGGPDAKAYDLSSSYGNVELEDKNADQIMISSSDGKIKCRSVTCKTFAVKNSYGSLELSGIKAESLAIEASDGKISLDQIDAGSMDIENQYGGLDGKALKADAFSMRMSDGKCVLKQADFKKTKMKNSYGTLDIQLVGREEDYNYDIKTTYGSITVGGSKSDEEFNQDNRAERNFTAAASDGNIVITHTE